MRVTKGGDAEVVWQKGAGAGRNGRGGIVTLGSAAIAIRLALVQLGGAWGQGVKRGNTAVAMSMCSAMVELGGEEVKGSRRARAQQGSR